MYRRLLLLTIAVMIYVLHAIAWAQEVYGDSISGTLLMLDDKTPHVATPVQAIRDGKLIATGLSNGDGDYRLTNLKTGVYQLRCQVLGGYIYYGEEKAGKPSCRMWLTSQVMLSSMMI